MKKVHVFVGVLVVAAVIGVVFLLNQDRPAGAPVVKNDPVKPIKIEEEAPVDGPLSFWNGEVIIGEGPNRGKIELVAALGKEAVVLTADKQGVCRFDTIPGMKPGEMYIRLPKRGHAPLLSFTSYEGGKEVDMHPVYQLSRAVQDGKITPLLAPDIMSPAERKTRQQGQHLEGFTWSLRTHDSQVYGRERKKDPTGNYASTAIELAPPVRVNLTPVIIDLTRYYFTDEYLAKMAKEDRKFDKYGEDRKNGLTEIKTSVGVFRKVSCGDRHSIDPNAKNGGGWRFTSLQLPNGKWMNDLLSIETTIELDGALYFIGHHHVLKWISSEKLERVVTFEGLDGKWAPYISPSKTKDGFLASRYLSVNKSGESDFGGLLEYRKGTWLFHQYNGDYGSWVEAVEEKEGHLVLTLFGGRKVQFNQTQAVFSDL